MTRNKGERLKQRIKATYRDDEFCTIKKRRQVPITKDSDEADDDWRHRMKVMMNMCAQKWTNTGNGGIWRTQLLKTIDGNEAKIQIIRPAKVIQRIEDEERRLEEKKKYQASREMEAAAREDVKEYVEKDEELAKTNDEIVKIKQEIESLPTREEMTDMVQKATSLEEEKEAQLKDLNSADKGDSHSIEKSWKASLKPPLANT